MFPLFVAFLILFPLLAAFSGLIVSKKLGELPGSVWAAGCSLLTLAAALSIYSSIGSGFEVLNICGIGLSFQLSGLQYLLSVLAALLWVGAQLFVPYYFSGHGNTSSYNFFSLLTLGAIQGVFLSGDFFTSLFFFEIMSLSSWVLVAYEKTPAAIDAASSYLAFAIIGGMSSLMGLFLLLDLCGTLSYSQLPSAAKAFQGDIRLYIAGAFIFVGFGTKAGLWPLHTWLPAAHPAAPAPASALLSGIITKAGIFGLFSIAARLFLKDWHWGMFMLLVGAVTMFTGAFLALFSIDLKRTLACSSMSQLGFIALGTGMTCILADHNSMAVWGSVLHIVNHSTLKLGLFLCAGVAVHRAHSRDLNRLRGFGRGKPLFSISFLSSALGLMCIPGFGGYISKTLLHESIVEYIGLLNAAGENSLFFRGIEFLFLLSGGLTVAYMCKLCSALFLAAPEREKHCSSKYISPMAGAVLVFTALLPPFFGLLPHLSLDKIASLSTAFFSAHDPDHVIAYYSFTNLKGSLISITIGILVYVLFVRRYLIKDGRYIDRWPRSLDLERLLYRPLVMRWIPFIFAVPSRLLSSLFEWLSIVSGYLLTLNNSSIGEIPDDSAWIRKIEDEERGQSATLSCGIALTGTFLVICISFVLYKAASL